MAAMGQPTDSHPAAGVVSSSVFLSNAGSVIRSDLSRLLRRPLTLWVVYSTPRVALSLLRCCVPQITNPSYMVPSSFGSATSVRVANLLGGGLPRKARTAAW